MSAAASEDIELILETIDKAFQLHKQWHEDLIRTLLCRLPVPPSVTAKDAHNHCEFGGWLYGERNSRLHDLPAFAKIDALHKAMHDAARELYLKMEVNGKVLEEDYDYYIRKLDQFRDELTEFRQRVLATLNHVASS
jgi:diguanylate cyclase